MKNLPKKIYLQVIKGDCTKSQTIDDYKELFESGITWNSKRQNETDVEYVLNDCFVPQPKQEVCEHKNIRENISGGRFDECLDCGKIWG